MVYLGPPGEDISGEGITHQSAPTHHLLFHQVKLGRHLLLLLKVTLQVCVNYD